MRSRWVLAWGLLGLTAGLAGPVTAQVASDLDDWPKRAAALADTEPCAPALPAALDDPHWYVRARAIQRLGQQRCSAAVPALVARFDREDWDNQARIIVALGQVGDAAGFPLVARATEAEPSVLRAVALGALEGFDDTLVAPVLTQLIEKPLTLDEKRLVARHVGRLRLETLVSKLAGWFGQDAELDRSLALAWYRTGDQSFGARVIEDFARFDAPTQLRLLQDWAQVPETRASAVLLTMVQSASPLHRLAAAEAWAAYGAQAPLAETLDALPLLDAEIQPFFTATLRARPTRETVEAIIERLKGDPPAAARAAYVEVLASLDRDQVAPLLLAARQARVPAIEPALEKLGLTTDALNAQLADPGLSPLARVDVALRLGQLGDAKAFETLRQLFASGDQPTQHAVMAAFGQLGDARAVELLFEALDDDTPSIQAAAATTLERLGVTPARLLANLDSPNIGLRVESLRLLGRLGHASALDPVAARLRHTEPLVVRLAAAAALGRMRRAEAVPFLAGLLQDREPALRLQAATALGEVGDERAAAALLPLLRERDALLVSEVVTALAKTQSTAAMAPLLTTLEHPDWRVRAAAARSLGDCNDARIPPALALALRDASALVRFYARQSLLKLAAAPTDALLRLVERREPRGWYGAYEVLQQLAPEAAREALLRQLDAPDPSARALAAALLPAYQDQPTLDALLRRLDSENRFSARWWLARAIGTFGETARESAVKRARSKQPRLRADAMRVLGWLPPNPESRTVLREALADADAQVRSAAVEALGRLGDVAALAPLLARQAGEFTVTLDELADALLACGDPGRNLLRQAVTRSDAAVRAVLLQRLGEDGNPDVLPLLLDAIRDASPVVRRAARLGLERQSDDRAAQALRAMPETLP
ncbi:HEAT repeat domain-containing protein [Chloracidobacterium validum]|uniref:HEAT repeat domain-containing protein n=1 Tax=Chloracidobacterium validum TaxID=2821543 RepID=A0ABX8B9D7_9BACT|nr:HEAT repeat domain-containing protein [Chloracidobacterium validum]QUW03047.1 HEAT repeat domain-containing protein [Chloracidobacterium validum]